MQHHIEVGLGCNELTLADLKDCPNLKHVKCGQELHFSEARQFFAGRTTHHLVLRRAFWGQKWWMHSTSKIKSMTNLTTSYSKHKPQIFVLPSLISEIKHILKVWLNPGNIATPNHTLGAQSNSRFMLQIHLSRPGSAGSKAKIIQANWKPGPMATPDCVYMFCSKKWMKEPTLFGWYIVIWLNVWLADIQLQ